MLKVYYTFYDGQKCPANLWQYEAVADTELELDIILERIYQQHNIEDLLVVEQ